MVTLVVAYRRRGTRPLRHARRSGDWSQYTLAQSHWLTGRVAALHQIEPRVGVSNKYIIKSTGGCVWDQIRHIRWNFSYNRSYKTCCSTLFRVKRDLKVWEYKMLMLLFTSSVCKLKYRFVYGLVIFVLLIIQLFPGVLPCTIIFRTFGNKILIF